MTGLGCLAVESRAALFSRSLLRYLALFFASVRVLFCVIPILAPQRSSSWALPSRAKVAHGIHLGLSIRLTGGAKVPDARARRVLGPVDAVAVIAHQHRPIRDALGQLHPYDSE